MADPGAENPEGEEVEKPIEVPEPLNLLVFWDLIKTWPEGKGADLSDCTVKLAQEGEGDEPPAEAPADGAEADPDKPPPEPSEFKCHKIVLCSASGYFFKQFVVEAPDNSDVELPKLPEDPHVKEQVPVGKIFPLILRYIYSNQNWAVISDSVTEENAVGVWALATLLDIKTLIQHSRDFILQNVLDASSASRLMYIATQFGATATAKGTLKAELEEKGYQANGEVVQYIDDGEVRKVKVKWPKEGGGEPLSQTLAVEPDKLEVFDGGKSLQDVCLEKIMSEFCYVLEASYDSELKAKEEPAKDAKVPPPSGLDLLCKLPVDILASLLDSDELNVRAEHEVFRVIRHLLHERLNRAESTLTLSDLKLTDISPDHFPKKAPLTAVWEVIVVEGPTRPELGGKEAHTALYKKYSVKTPPVRIEVAEDDTFDLSGALGAIPHEGEGDPPENPNQLKLTFPTKGLTDRSGSVILQAVIETEVSGSIQRELLAEALIPPQAWLPGEMEAAEGDGGEGGGAGFNFELLCAGKPVAVVTCGKEVATIDSDGKDEEPKADDAEQTTPITGGPLKPDDTNKILQCLRFPELRHEELVEANEDPWLSEAGAQPYIIEAFSSRLSKIEPIYKGRPGEGGPKGPRPSTLGRSGGPKAGGVRRQLPKSPSHGQPPTREPLALTHSPTHQRPQQSQLAIPGADTHLHGIASASSPIYFDRISDFDENGALYFLGTRGLTRVWANPCGLPQPVQVMTSGIGFGSKEEFLARPGQPVNLRTRNEPGSYLGVDLGGGLEPGSARLLRIRGYCLRSRNATSHAPICWDFQGSADGANWETLDKRRNDRQLMKRDEKAYYQVQTPPPPMPQRGQGYGAAEPPAYRCFRIWQPPGEKNSSGSDNLVLSGIELYGEAVQGMWA